MLLQSSTEPWLQFLPRFAAKFVYFHDVRADIEAKRQKLERALSHRRPVDRAKRQERLLLTRLRGRRLCPHAIYRLRGGFIFRGRGCSPLRSHRYSVFLPMSAPSTTKYRAAGVLFTRTSWSPTRRRCYLLFLGADLAAHSGTRTVC